MNEDYYKLTFETAEVKVTKQGTDGIDIVQTMTLEQAQGILDWIKDGAAYMRRESNKTKLLVLISYMLYAEVDYIRLFLKSQGYIQIAFEAVKE